MRSLGSLFDGPQTKATLQSAYTNGMAKVEKMNSQQILQGVSVLSNLARNIRGAQQPDYLSANLSKPKLEERHMKWEEDRSSNEGLLAAGVVAVGAAIAAMLAKGDAILDSMPTELVSATATLLGCLPYLGAALAAIVTILILRRLALIAFQHYQGAMGAEITTRLINETLEHGNLPAYQARNVFNSINVVKNEKKSNSQHTHPESAASRNAGRATANLVASQLGYTMYSLQATANEQRKHLGAGVYSNGKYTARNFDMRTFHWAKDLEAEARPLEEHNERYAYFWGDMEHYVKPEVMSDFLATRKTTHFISTMQPTCTGLSSGEYSFSFNEEDYVHYKVSGGAEYRHKLFDWKGDVVVVQTNSLLNREVVAYAIDRKPLDDNHQLIMLTFIGSFSWPLLPVSWAIENHPLRYLKVNFGDFNVLDIQRKDGLYRSISRVNDPYSSTLKWEAVSALHNMARNTNMSKINAAMVATLLANNNGLNLPVTTLPNAEVHLWVGYLNWGQAKNPSVMYPPDSACKSYFVGKHDFEVAPTMQNFGQPLVKACFAPVKSLMNDDWCVRERIERFTDANLKTKDGQKPEVPPFALRYMEEFIAQMVPDSIAGTLHPFPVEEVHDRQPRPTQRKKFEFGAGIAAWFAKKRKGHYNDEDRTKESGSTHQKTETYPKAAPPRNIFEPSDQMKVDWARFVYQISEMIMKNMPWYAFGKPPRELAERIAKMLTGADHANCSDASKFDGHVALICRMLEQALMLRAFAPQHHSHIIELMQANVGLNCYTAFSRYYFSGYSRGSGDAATADFNSMFTAYIDYCAARETLVNGVKMTHKQAWACLLAYGGDDAININIDPNQIKKMAKLFGQEYEVETYPRGAAKVNFLNRYFSQYVWNGDENSMSDPQRALSKFFTCAKNVVDPRKRVGERASGYYKMDRNTPVLGTLIALIHDVMFKDEDWTTGTEISRESLSPWFGNVQLDNNWPNTDSDWMEDMFYTFIPDFDMNTFKSWVYHCRTTMNADFIFRAPLCVPEIQDDQTKVIKEPVVVGDELLFPAKPVAPVAPAPIEPKLKDVVGMAAVLETVKHTVPNLHGTPEAVQAKKEELAKPVTLFEPKWQHYVEKKVEHDILTIAARDWRLDESRWRKLEKGVNESDYGFKARCKRERAHRVAEAQRVEAAYLAGKLPGPDPKRAVNKGVKNAPKQQQTAQPKLSSRATKQSPKARLTPEELGLEGKRQVAATQQTYAQALMKAVNPNALIGPSSIKQVTERIVERGFSVPDPLVVRNFVEPANVAAFDKTDEAFAQLDQIITDMGNPSDDIELLSDSTISTSSRSQHGDDDDDDDDKFIPIDVNFEKEKQLAAARAQFASAFGDTKIELPPPILGESLKVGNDNNENRQTGFGFQPTADPLPTIDGMLTEVDFVFGVAWASLGHAFNWTKDRITIMRNIDPYPTESSTRRVAIGLPKAKRLRDKLSIVYNLYKWLDTLPMREGRMKIFNIRFAVSSDNCFQPEPGIIDYHSCEECVVEHYQLIIQQLTEWEKKDFIADFRPVYTWMDDEATSQAALAMSMMGSFNPYGNGQPIQISPKFYLGDLATFEKFLEVVPHHIQWEFRMVEFRPFDVTQPYQQLWEVTILNSPDCTITYIKSGDEVLLGFNEYGNQQTLFGARLPTEIGNEPKFEKFQMVEFSLGVEDGEIVATEKTGSRPDSSFTTMDNYIRNMTLSELKSHVQDVQRILATRQNQLAQDTIDRERRVRGFLAASSPIGACPEPYGGLTDIEDLAGPYCQSCTTALRIPGVVCQYHADGKKTIGRTAGGSKKGDGPATNSKACFKCGKMGHLQAQCQVGGGPRKSIVKKPINKPVARIQNVAKLVQASEKRILSQVAKTQVKPKVVPMARKVVGSSENWSAWEHVHDNGIHQYRRRKGTRRVSGGSVNVMHVQGTELLTTISGNIDEGTRVYQLDVNPQDVGVELPIESLPYDECEWNEFSMLAVPATNLQGSGQLIMAYANDPSNPIPPESLEGNQLMSSWKHHSFAIWEKGECRMPTKDGRRKFYIHDAAPGEVDDQRMTVAGRAFIQAMTDLTPADGGAATVIYCKYDIVLIDPSLDEDVFAAGTVMCSGLVDNLLPNSTNVTVSPFRHVYETVDDAAGDAAATYFTGDLSFIRKIGDGRLILSKGQYHVTFTLGGIVSSVNTATGGMDWKSLPSSITNGSSDGPLFIHGSSNVTGLLTPVSLNNYAYGIPRTSATNPNNIISGGYAQLGVGSGSQQTTPLPMQAAAVVTNAFLIIQDGTAMDFDQFIYTTGVDLNIRSCDMVLTRLNDRSDSNEFTISGAFSRALLNKYNESQRPWRLEAVDNVLKKKLSKLDADDLTSEELLIFKILMDEKINEEPEFLGAIAPMLLELLKHAGIAVGGAVLKHAVGKFEGYCKKHEKRHHEAIELKPHGPVATAVGTFNNVTDTRKWAKDNSSVSFDALKETRKTYN
jgi:hypothetical protein